jgi:hypothetical protein
VYNTKEYTFNARKLVSQVFRRMQDVNPKAPVSRRQAEEWRKFPSYILWRAVLMWTIPVFFQDQIAQRVNTLAQFVGEPRAHVFSRRPWQATWFATQVAICLQLYAQDPTLTNALALGKSFLQPCDILDALWQSPHHQERTSKLRERLEAICDAVNISRPLPAISILPPALLNAVGAVSHAPSYYHP